MWCFLLLALNIPVQLQKGLLCRGIAEFGKEIWVHLMQNTQLFQLQASSPLPALSSVSSASQGDKLLQKQLGFKSQPFYIHVLRPKDTWLLEPRFPYPCMEIMYVKHLAYCQIPARCFQPESIIKLTSKPCSSPYLTHVRKCHFHSFIIYIKNPGIIFSYTLIPSTSTPASLASSHTSGPLHLLSLYLERFHQTLSRCGHMLLHCTECVLSSAYVW